MKINIAIPSYKRADKQLTLDYLEAIKYPVDNRFLFVQTEDDYKEYQKHKHRVNKIILARADNLTEQLNNILDYFPQNEFIVKLDDDIKHISYLLRKRLYPIKSHELLYNFLKHGFSKAISLNTPLWGIYPVHNQFFMNDNHTDWALIMGTFLGIINDGIRFDERYKLKQDYELSCRILKTRGKVLRFNNVAANAGHFSNPGGCKEYRDKYYDEIFSLFLKEHGDIVKPNPKRENEILLRRKK